MRTKAFSQLKIFSFEFREPVRAFQAMRVYLDKVIAHAKATCARNLVDRYIKNGIAFNDVEALAKSATKGMKSTENIEKMQKKIENIVMKTKLEDASKTVAEVKKIYEQK